MASQWTETGIAGELGVARRIANLACISGMRYPLPQWFLAKPATWRLAWRAFYTCVEMSLSIMITSMVMMIIKSGAGNIGVMSETIGSMFFLFFGIFKSQLIYRKRNLLCLVVGKLHKVAEQLGTNPIGTPSYLQEHKKRCRKWQIYSEIKPIAVAVAFGIPILQVNVHGLLYPSADHPLPMHAWFPLNYASRPQFSLICILQYLYYSLVVQREIFADMTLLLVLSTVNVQMIFMRRMLINLVERKGGNKGAQLAYWIQLHREILSILADFKAITGPCLFATYIYVSLISSSVLFRLTSEQDFAITQQTAIVGTVSSNLLHMYLISTIGDELAKNSLALADAVESPRLWDLKRDEQRKVLQIAVRCTKPICITFGDNRKLCTGSFGDIVTCLLSYFNTIYQLRN